MLTRKKHLPKLVGVLYLFFLFVVILKELLGFLGAFVDSGAFVSPAGNENKE